MGDYLESIVWSSFNKYKHNSYHMVILGQYKDNSYHMVIFGHFQRQFQIQLPHFQA
jgi:hypothetical protein